MIDGGFIILDELVAAMPDKEEEVQQYMNEVDVDEQPEWVRIAMRIQDNLNEYLENATVLAVNGVNLLGVDLVRVDPVTFRKDLNDYSIGLMFFGPSDESGEPTERALVIVDAAKYNLRLDVEDGAASLCTVDKLGRRAF